MGLRKKLSAPDTSVKKVNEKCVVEMFTWTLLESKNQRQNNYRRKMHCVRKRISLRVPRLAVFDGGQVVQQGTHEELVAEKGGKYYELWHAQAQYYAKEA